MPPGLALVGHFLEKNCDFKFHRWWVFVDEPEPVPREFGVPDVAGPCFLASRKASASESGWRVKEQKGWDGEN